MQKLIPVITIILTLNNCSKVVNNLNIINKNINNNLIDAVQLGNIEDARMLLNKGADIDYKDSNGNTPLMIASKKAYAEIVELLLKKKANINAKDSNGDTALTYTSRYGQKEIVNLLLKSRANVNHKNNYGETALIWAAYKGHTESVRLLIEKGANINAKDNYGYTALINASMYGYTEIVRLLLEEGANVNDKDNRGNTALIYISLKEFKEYREIVELLIEKGANVDDKTDFGFTVLINASIKGHKGIVELLLERGADVNYKDKGGKKALVYVSEKIRDVNLSMEEKSKYVDIAYMLIEAMEKQLVSVHSKASSSERGKVVKKSKRKKMHIDKKLNKYIEEPIQFFDFLLIHASESGNIEIAKLLIEKGANVNHNDSKGSTALMLVSNKIKDIKLSGEEKNKYVEIAYILIEAMRKQLLNFCSKPSSIQEGRVTKKNKNIHMDKELSKYLEKSIQLFNFLLYTAPKELFIHIIEYVS